MKSVRPINVRRLLASDSDFVKDCKEQQTLLVPAFFLQYFLNRSLFFSNLCLLVIGHDDKKNNFGKNQEQQQQQQKLATNGGREVAHNSKQPLALAKVSIVVHVKLIQFNFSRRKDY